MSISKSDITKASMLAKLKDNAADDEQLCNEINKILDFVDQLKNCDTKGVAPLFHPFDLHQRMREDVADHSNYLQELKSIAPSFEDDHYLVPKVIDES